jgi:hypothetical protein
VTSGHVLVTGIDALRRAVRVLNQCNESFNQEYSATQLLSIVDALSRSTHDILPDQWTDKQIRDAIRLFKAPIWDENERPVE